MTKQRHFSTCSLGSKTPGRFEMEASSPIISFLLYSSFNWLKKGKQLLKPALKTPSEQGPPVNNGWFDSSLTSLNPTFIRHLFQTATFFRSQGGLLNTGSTVFFLIDFLLSYFKFSFVNKKSNDQLLVYFFFNWLKNEQLFMAKLKIIFNMYF